MSRCFPFPPPGYTPSRASNEALIESIKLQREREKAKAERKKEKKRDKKEKKKAKEEEAKQIKTTNLDHWKEKKDKKDDTEQLERSSITEEHEQPISSQNPSYSSDSTQNSGKRKRHPPPLNVTRPQGNILRIRLPSQKRIKHDIRDGKDQLKDATRGDIRDGKDQLKDATRGDIRDGKDQLKDATRGDIRDGKDQPICLPSEKHLKDATRGGEEQICSTSGRTNVPSEHNNNVVRADNSHPTSQTAEFIVHDHPPITVQELRQPNTVEPQDDTCYLENVHTDSGSKRHRKLKRVGERYRDLIENWTPPSMLSDATDDDDWLFPRKHEVNLPEKKLVGLPERTCSSSSQWWARAHFLPEADIYALPYTIPF